MLYQPYPFKRCSKCGCEFLASRIFFFVCKSHKDGLGSNCKNCDCKKRKQYRLEHLEQEKTRSRFYARSHSEEIAEAKRQYYEEHKAQIEAYKRQWYLANHEKLKERARHHYKTHRKEIIARNKEYTRTHPTLYRAIAHRYDQKHKEQANARNRNKRARYKQSEGKHDQRDIQAQLKRQHGKCYYCGELVDKYHVDHVIPLSRGGGNGPDNLVISCPKCNMSKNDKMPHEWPQGGRLL